MPDYLLDKDLNVEWGNLYKNIFNRYKRQEDRHGTDINRPNTNLAKAYLLLLPIAYLLQEDTSLHYLMPWQHHGVFDLFLINQKEDSKQLIIRILPLGENTYRLSFYDPNSTLGYAQVKPYKEIGDVLLGKVYPLMLEGVMHFAENREGAVKLSHYGSCF